MTINSINFICNWKYNVPNDVDTCVLCRESLDNDKKPNYIIKLQNAGLVLGKCGHPIHLYCMKRSTKYHNKRNQVFNCPNCGIEFQFDKYLDEPMTQKIYKC